MNYKRIPRLFVDEKLDLKQKIKISNYDKHYLKKVLRLRIKDKVYLFNGKDGEWEAEISQDKVVTLVCLKKTKCFSSELGPSLFFSVIKQNSLRLMLEKATELGVESLIPVYTDYTNFKNFNYKKSLLYLKEASQVSERLNIPYLSNPIYLKEVIEKIKKDDKILIFCDEERKSKSIKHILDNVDKSKVCFLIGPEGGFSDDERKFLNCSENVKSVNLGNRILRAETAAIAVLAAFKLN